MEPRTTTPSNLNLNDGRWYYLEEQVPFTGIVLDQHPNGEKKYELPYKDGLQCGVEKEWYENGDRRSELTWLNGKKNGPETVWFKDGGGQISLACTWKNGRYDGAYVSFHKDGTIAYQVSHKDGKELTPIRKFLNFFF